MTRVVLLGGLTPDTEALLPALARIAPDLEIDASPRASHGHDRASAADVALIAAGDGAPAKISALVSQAGDAGLPVVALLPRVELFELDPASFTLDFCFPPFKPEEVALRLRVAARRSRRQVSTRRITAGELAIDEDRYEVRISGRKVDLTYKEYELLKVLAANPGRVFSREALLRTVWEYDYFGGTRTVDVHVRRLRAKINDANHRFIETVWNVGYRFRAPDRSGQ